MVFLVAKWKQSQKIDLKLIQWKKNSNYLKLKQEWNNETIYVTILFKNISRGLYINKKRYNKKISNCIKYNEYVRNRATSERLIDCVVLCREMQRILIQISYKYEYKKSNMNNVKKIKNKNNQK